MAKYPNWAVGLDVSAANLALGIPNIVTKSAAQSRSGTATLADDSELVNISLAVGTHWVRLLLLAYADTSATPDIKTAWTFSGTWNNPGRARVGPGGGNTASPSAITPLLMGVTAAGTSGNYGFASGTTPYVITEESFNVVVTVAGNLALQWAQNTSDASNTTVAAGSTFITRQIA
jgi:hypothetical protein